MTPAQEKILNDNAEAERQRRDLYRHVFSGEKGLRVLRDLAVTFDLEGPAFKGDFNPHAAAQRDGQKQVVKHILKYSSNINQDGDSQEG